MTTKQFQIYQTYREYMTTSLYPTHGWEYAALIHQVPVDEAREAVMTFCREDTSRRRMAGFGGGNPRIELNKNILQNVR